MIFQGCYSHCIAQALYPCSYELVTFPVVVFTATTSGVATKPGVRAAAKISARGVGSPNYQLYMKVNGVNGGRGQATCYMS